ncbi:MAG: sugar transferase [Firmicutes bacterium]|nr:sugar transferase [Bacillota bacterium]
MLDILVSLVGIVVLSPVFVVIGLLVALDLGRPVLFVQERIGLHGKPFVLYKYRTMRNAMSRSGELMPDAQRLTKFGRILRSTSLDELPELLNVLVGQMSLVGPRPLLPEYLDRYTPEQARRHEVKPGITGWAQVNGRNALTWEERFKLDVWYADNWSILLDVKILFMTITTVIRRDGISSEGHATMPEFRGSAHDG